MEPLHLLVHAADPANAARIDQALRAGAPGCRVECQTDPTAFWEHVKQQSADGFVADQAGTAEHPTISPTLRHDLNNHLALIRMLADLLAEDRSVPPSFTAKAREIAAEADAAAQTLRRTKKPLG